MMLEAVQVMPALWSGEVVSHHGRHYTVDTARLYTVPDTTPPVYVSALGPKALEVAARIGDGFITTQPDGESVAQFRQRKGGPRAPAMAGCKVAYAATAEEGLDHAHRLWANAGLPDELSQVLPSPQHFEQAASLVTGEATPGPSSAATMRTSTARRSSRSSGPASTRCTSRTWVRVGGR
jgi:G6PDH family F420-dependent oxidoreductase